MNNEFKTPTRYEASSSRTLKRDTLAAELERDPQLSTAKRRQQTQAFTSQVHFASLERQLLSAQTSKTELETKLKEKELTVERLERDRRWFADREKEEREEKEKERSEREEEKRKTDAELKNLRNNLTSLREAHADLQDEFSTLQRTSSQSILSQKSQISTLSHQVEGLSVELTQFQDLAEERRTTIENLRERLNGIAEAEEERVTRPSEGDRESDAILREELQRQVEHMRTLESANARMENELRALLERHASVEVLREEKRGLERKLVGLEEMREQIVKLEAEVEAGRREREDWARSTARQDTPSNIPVSVTQTLSQLRLSHARLLEEQGSTLASLRRREADLLEAEAQEVKLTQKIDTLEMEVRSLRDKVARREQRVLLAEREVGFLQAMVASFTAEEMSLGEGVADEVQIARLQELEALVVEFKATNDKLTAEMDALGGDPATLGQGRSRGVLTNQLEEERSKLLEVQQALEEAQTESTTHLAKIDELEQSLFELGGEIAGGRHVPPNRRVLSFKENPVQEWFDLRQSVMDGIKAENEALLKRLKELEGEVAKGGGGTVPSAPGAGGELVPRESWELVNQDKEKLEEALKQKEKRLLRLQQVFTSKSAEFRETIASILGLKLTFYPNGQIRVTSVYDLNASFVFQPSKGDAKMQLVAQGEGGPQELPQLMQYWIGDQQCTPGFLAAVTLECYDIAQREGTL